MGTIAERYEDDTTFTDLLTRIQIPVREKNKLVNDGFTSLDLLVDQYSSDINEVSVYLKHLNKTFGARPATSGQQVNYTPFIISRIVGLTFYYAFCVKALHTIPDPDLIETEHVMEYYKFYKQVFKPLEDIEEDEDTTPKIPELSDHHKWIKFRDSFKEKLSHTIGERKIPITYVIDNTKRPVTRANADLLESDELIDISDIDSYDSRIMQFGSSYKKDSKLVWDILRSLLFNTPAWYHISSFDTTKNGRGAHNALVDFYQGDDFNQFMIDEAFVILNRTFYRGETKVFTFDKFIKLHLKAHSMLVEAGYNQGKGMDEATKVQHLKGGIKAKANLESALIAMRSGTININSFHAVKSFLAGEIQARKVRTDELDNNRRNVSGMSNNSGNHNKSKKSNKKKTYGTPLTAYVDGKRVEGRSYSKEDWKKLSQPQRNKVKDLLKQRRNTSSNSPGISAITTDNMRDDLVTLGDAIIAGVQRASTASYDNTPDDASALTSTSKRKADAGSVGDIFGKRRRAPNTNV